MYVQDKQVNLLALVKYTQLPELWDIFQSIVAISPVNESGFSLIGASSYLQGIDLQVTHSTFWNIMVYFLRRLNEQFRAKMKARLKNGK